MSRTSAILAFAGLAFAATNLAFAPAAEAGSGVRLQFGGPLGSFVARENPAIGSAKPSGYGSHAAKKHDAKAAHAARLRQQKLLEARARAAAEAKAKAVAQAQAKAKAEAIAAAKAQKAAHMKAAAQKQQAAAAVQQAKATPAVKTPVEAETTAPSSVSTALVSGNLPVAEPIQAADPVIDPSVEVLPVQTIAAETVEETDEATTTLATADAGPVECKKFIPAVGVTVTVGCEE